MPAPDALETTRLHLRAVTEADAPAMQRNFGDYAVISELAAGVPWPYPPDGAKTFIVTHILPEKPDRWIWGIFFKHSPAELIGVIDLWREEKPENRGFWLGKAYWGEGLMTEASTAVTNYAFDHLGFSRLVFANAVGNTRSHRIKEKAGAKILRVEPARFVNPAYTEREVWELTKADWQRRAIPPRRW